MQLVSDWVRQKVQEAAPPGQPPVEITLATQPQFGHYQCNSALKWSKSLGIAPRVIAEQMAQRIDRSCFAKVEVAGPGFLNITLAPQTVCALLERMQEDPAYGLGCLWEGKRVVVDFSSPNIAKEMHVGHLRSTILGDAIARLFAFLGADVLRLNHVGDWGTSFGMLIAYMQVHQLREGTIASLMDWYRAAKAQFDQDQAFQETARRYVVLLQEGNQEVVEIWQLICNISRKAFQEVYELLDVQLEERGESFYNPWLAWIVDDLSAKGIVQESQGAKCVFHEGYDLPYMVQKSDGGYNYDTTDLAALWHRVTHEKADRIIVVTDAGQSVHFALLAATARRAGYLGSTRLDHVPFGLVLGEDGKKFRTRSGDIVRLIDLLRTAQEQAEQLLAARNPEENPQQRQQRALILGIDAVKYADLSCHRGSDYVFSYERMLRFEGNTAAFNLYAYVRLMSIRKRLQTGTEGPLQLDHSSEIALALHLLLFPEVLLQVAETLLPHLLTEYIYELATRVNQFLRDCRVEGTPEQASRLTLCRLAEKTLATSFDLLGLKTLSTM